MPHINGWTPSLIIAVIVTIGAFIILAIAPESTASNVVVGWVSIIVATFFANGISEKERVKTDKKIDEKIENNNNADN